MTNWIEWTKLLAPWCIAGIVWITRAEAKLKSAPTREEVHEETRKVQEKLMSELQPMKEDLREIKSDIKWLTKEKK